MMNSIRRRLADGQFESLCIRAQSRIALAVAAFITVGLSACISSRPQIYDGPVRPLDEVAVVNCIGARVWRVRTARPIAGVPSEWTRTNASHLELLPGHYFLHLHAGTTKWGLRVAGTAAVRLTVEAGARYDVVGVINEAKTQVLFVGKKVSPLEEDVQENE